MIRTTGDIIALYPPRIIDKAQTDRTYETLRDLRENSNDTRQFEKE